MTNTDREAFEAWASNSPVNLAKHNDGMYASSVAAFAWRAYKAATQRQKSRIAELEAEVQALRKDAEWLPIETAPKTSRAILVHCSDRKNTYTACYGKVGGFLQADGWRHFGGGGDMTEEPTHWMPLPPPPGIVGKEGA